MQTRYRGAALVTGASSGIGRHFCEQLAERGMDVILVARREQRLREVAAAVEKHSVRSLVIAQDLLAEGAIAAVFAAIDAAGWDVGLLVNNAGFATYGEFAAQDLDAQARMIDLNCRVPLALTNAFLPGMRQRDSGGIIFVASLAAFQPTPFFASYGASKAFVLMFGEALWSELQDTGIDVVTVCPGNVPTEFHEVAGMDERFGMRLEVLPPERVVEAALDGLGKQPTVTPGILNNLASRSVGLMPRKAVARIAGWLNAPKRRS